MKQTPSQILARKVSPSNKQTKVASTLASQQSSLMGTPHQQFLSGKKQSMHPPLVNGGHKTQMGFCSRLSVVTNKTSTAGKECKEKLRKTPDPARPMFKVNSLSMLGFASTTQLSTKNSKAQESIFKVEKKVLKPIPEKVKSVYAAKGPKETHLKFVSATIP